jgi:tyrosinase
MATDIRIRAGIHNLTDQNIADLRSAYGQIQAISDNRGFQYQAGLHGVPSWYCWHHQQNSRIAQQMELFLPWHRAYLYNFEMALRDQVPGVTLPWWDWTLRSQQQNGLPTSFTDAKGADGKPNPLKQFKINLPATNPPLVHTTKRHPGPPDQLPAQADVDDALAKTDWNDFTDAVESLHDQVHGWVSGDMGVIGTAAFDPIFWCHHAMIDRLWDLWQVKNGTGNISPDLLDQVLNPFNFKVRDVLNVADLGYDYAAGQVVVPVGG